jgi:O-antigen ligase
MAMPKINFPRPTLPQAVLVGLLVFAASVDFTRKISLGAVSGQGACTIAVGGAIWAIWLLRPVMVGGLLPVLLPLMLFELDAAGTLLWYRPGQDGVQLLTVALTFLAITLVTARETAADPGFARKLRWVIVLSSPVPVLVWAYLFLSGTIAGENLNLSRGFALYTLSVTAATLSLWRESAWPESAENRKSFAQWIRSLWPLVWIAFTALVVLLGMSRTALIVLLLLVPLSLLYRGSRRSILAGCCMLAIGGGLFAAMVFSYKPIYDRFFKEDASMKVGGVSINATGRTKIWNLLYATIGDDWIFGKGISASEDIINQCGMSKAGQPHNDYLRFYYDQGIVGLSLWLCYMAAFVYRTVNNLRRSIRDQSPDYPQHLAALLALTGVSLSMLTDNSYCYGFVMIPLGVLMGSSLGTGQHYAHRPIESVPEEFPTSGLAMR